MITNDGKQNDSSKTQLSLRTVGYGDYQGDDPTILIDSNLSPLGTTWGLRACVFFPLRSKSVKNRIEKNKATIIPHKELNCGADDIIIKARSWH